MSPQSKGGQVIAKRSREEALRKYYENPNICLTCNSIIDVPNRKKVCEIRLKKFCNSSCASKRNNRTRKRTRKIRTCLCGNILPQYRKQCHTCFPARSSKIGVKTKGELFSSRKNWQSARSCIRKHAYQVFLKSKKPMECLICSYNKHVEICHKKSVSSFSNETTLNVINDTGNLEALCPNHHWEYDNGVLTLEV